MKNIEKQKRSMKNKNVAKQKSPRKTGGKNINKKSPRKIGGIIM